MRLHENKELFRQAILAASKELGIQEIYIEKDYWVTVALYKIFRDKIGEDVIFKGGTSLSKCFSIIERFSEDIDLVLIRNDLDSNNKMKNKIRIPSQIIVDILPEINVDDLTNKKGMIRKTVHEFPKTFKGKFGQVREDIILETTWLGRYEPYHEHMINSYIGEIMIKQKQDDLIKEYKMEAFRIQVLHVHRTMCEKIMSLVRFSYGKDPISQLKDKIRHTYDIHQLLKLQEVSDFFDSSGFDEMMITVFEDDKLSFKNENDWLNYHPSESLMFSKTNSVWDELKSTYKNEFADLVHGILPEEKKVMKSLERVQTSLKDIKFKL